MSEPAEIAPGVWISHNEQTGANYGVVLGDNAYMTIAPGASEPDACSRELKALADFFNDRATGAYASVVIGGYDGGPDSEIWSFSISGDRPLPPRPDIQALVQAHSIDLVVPGWELISPSGPDRPVVYGRAERVLFCGGMLSDVDIPSVPRGSQQHLDNLESIERMDVKIVVPGTGSVARGKREIRGRIERDRQYLHALRRHVQTSQAARVPLDRALHAARSIYEDYPFVDRHVRNVSYVWTELA